MAKRSAAIGLEMQNWNSLVYSGGGDAVEEECTRRRSDIQPLSSVVGNENVCAHLEAQIQVD